MSAKYSSILSLKIPLYTAISVAYVHVSISPPALLQRTFHLHTNTQAADAVAPALPAATSSAQTRPPIRGAEAVSLDSWTINNTLATRQLQLSRKRRAYRKIYYIYWKTVDKTLPVRSYTDVINFHFSVTQTIEFVNHDGHKAIVKTRLRKPYRHPVALDIFLIRFTRAFAPLHTHSEKIIK